MAKLMSVDEIREAQATEANDDPNCGCRVCELIRQRGVLLAYIDMIDMREGRSPDVLTFLGEPYQYWTDLRIEMNKHLLEPGPHHPPEKGHDPTIEGFDKRLADLVRMILRADAAERAQQE